MTTITEMFATGDAYTDKLLKSVAHALELPSIASLLAYECDAGQRVSAVCVECETVTEDWDDQQSGFCECCHGNHVKSVLILAGVL